MSKALLTPVDLVNLASDPASPDAGWIYFNSTTGKIRLYDGTQWVDVPGAGGGGGATTTDDVGTLDVFISDAEAANPTPTDSAFFDLVATLTETNALPTSTDTLTITDAAGETNATPTHSTGDLTIQQDEANATPTEATHEFTITDAGEANATPTHTDTLTISDAGESNATPTDTVGDLTIQQDESNATPTEATHEFTITDSGETNALPTHTDGDLTVIDADQANSTPSETRLVTLRYWALTTTDNDASRTTPANANGPNDNARSVIKTNNATGDVTNPVILTTTDLSVPSTGITVSAARLRVWFNTPGTGVAWTDNARIQYTINGTTWNDVWVSTGAAENYDSGTFTFDVSSLTLAQLNALDIRASYQATVVASPQSRINLDAWCVEIDTTI